MTSQQSANVVFLTEQEAERIRSTVQGRGTKCSELKGERRKPRNTRDSISQAINASLMADMGGMIDPSMIERKLQGDSLPVLAVGKNFPPCILPLKDLKPMCLADLKIETHHRGSRLTVQRASPVVTLAARSWTMVQDETGDGIERLEIYLHRSRHSEEILESASAFILKEPYFTLSDQGKATLRIDHPSDLIVRDDELDEGRSTCAKEMNGPTENGTTVKLSAIIFKNEGNAALQQNNLPLAYKRYSQGLKAAKQPAVANAFPDLARDIYRNRAYINLLWNQLDEAVTDSKAALCGRQDQAFRLLDGKACFRAASAAYNLGQYQEAQEFFEMQKEYMSDDINLATNLRRVEKRLCEQQVGSYNLEKIRAKLSQSHPRVDAADYISNVEIKDSSGRGRGIFSNRDIAAGDIVMCEKAFCVVWGHESEALTAMTYDVRDDKIRVSPIGLTRSVVERLRNNPSQLEKVMDLYGDYQGGHSSVLKTEDGPVIDAFRVHDIVSRNAFGLGNQFGGEDETNSSTGLWLWASYLNHSCVPNARKEYIGDFMVLRATRHITAGEEIFHAYTESNDFESRQQALMTTWGFECKCALCTAEAADEPALRRKRCKLSLQADAFVENENWVNAKIRTIVRAEHLLLAIGGTYDDERYHDLPRPATRGIERWLVKARPRR